MLVADRVRASIVGSPISVGSDAVTVTASVGCATTVHEGADEVIGRADGAMYLAKRTGDAVVAAPEPTNAEPPRVADPARAAGATFPTHMATTPGVADRP